VIDASGTYSEVAQRVSIERLSRAGVTVEVIAASTRPYGR
jgi:hypothetical protein